jgi:hypothetical protein
MGTLNVVLGYTKQADKESEQKFGYMCLRFCDVTRTLPGFGGKVEKTVKVFRDALSKSLNEYPEEEMAAGKVVPDIVPVTRQAWGIDLADVVWPPEKDEKGKLPPKITGPWNDSDSYRSFLLIKAFMEGARFMSLRMGATVPVGADGAWDRMFKLSQEQDTTTMDDVSTKGYRAAVVRMKIIPPEYKEPEPVEKGKEPSGEPEKSPEKGKAPSKESEPNKDVLKTVETLGKRVQEFRDKKPFMTSDAQEKLQTLMEQILSLITPRPVPARTAALDDAFARLIEFMRPYLPEFLRAVQKEPAVPAEERIWSDPDRLREVMERMSPGQARAVLQKTEEILGLLHSLS